MATKFKKKYRFNPQSLKIKEQFFTICNNIEANLPDHPFLLIVTSLAQSQNIANASGYLALAYSEQRKRVLIVDANLYEPSLHYVFNVENTLGFSDLLLSEPHMNTNNPVRITDYLYCLPTSESIYEPTALLTMGSLPTLIDGWKEDFDVILFHTSDYLDTPIPQITAKLSDGIVLVIQEGRDKLEKIVDVKKQIEQSKHEVTGTIILSS
ncbi:capsular biosynthesis protein [Rossellomorea sp. BNER]|uniref:capsular biosynthesis protein n=1 Tax=Rossellomorea sp. BNER TaxID=2962031 RepID=UPI003AF2BBB5|nr:capsular biosynthesis protein [Rossellomorea sp. BNER]